MRITNNMITRNYTKSLHTNLNRLSQYNQQIISGRRFNTMSEDTASGVRGMQTRRSLQRIEGYRSNAQSTASLYDAAESNMMKISSLCQDILGKYVQGVDGTLGSSTGQGASDREIVANELDKLRDEMLACANGQFADRYLFGGTNTTSAPFKLDKDTNTLYYNGVDVATIDKSHALFQDAAYVDIGLGLNFEGTASPQQINPQSAFKNTFVGLDFLGTESENIILILGDMIGALRSENFDHGEAAALLTDFQNAYSDFGASVTQLGADTSFLEFTLDRLESEELNLKTRLQQIEGRSSEEAILDFKMQEFVYNAALQMGQRLLQPTLFSFIS